MLRHMLRWVSLEGWKSFGGGEDNIVGFGAVTFLVGPNASGKSNVLDALRVFQGLAQHVPIDGVFRPFFRAGHEVWPGIRGGAEGAAHGNEPRFQLILCVASGEGEGIIHDIVVNVEDAPTLERSEFAQLAEEEHATITVPRLELKRRRAIPAEEPRLDVYRDMLSERVVFSEVLTSLARGNAAAELARRVGEELDDRAREELSLWASELCAPAIDRIEPQLLKPGAYEIVAIERSGRAIAQESLSDGTLRFIDVVARLLGAKAGGVLVIEEPDIGLHPSRAHLLAGLFEQLCEQRKVQVIATTHSPALLAQLSDKALDDVVAFRRDAHGHASIARRVGNFPPSYRELLQKRDARERLISSGWLERAV